ncbi:MDR family MFS transporter [Faecalimicrobium sp. JNUCC 81]
MIDNKKTRNLIILVLMMGSLITSLTQTVLTSALPSIMCTFNVDAGTAQWLTTVYLLVLGIMIPSTAYLINRFSIKNLFITSMALFLVGCIISIFAKNFGIMIVSRILQAIGAGIIMQSVQVAMINLYPKEERGKAMGIYGFVIGVAPAIGPLAAGYIIDNLGWRVIFYILAFITLVNIVLAFLFLRSIMEVKKSKLEIISLILSTFGFGGILVGVSNIGAYSIISPLTYIPLIIGIVSLILFARRQLKVQEPLLELRVFKSRNFIISTVLIIIVYTAMTSASIIISIYIQSVRGMSAMVPGIIMLPGSIAMIILSPIAGNILDKYGFRTLAILGCLLLGLGTFELSTLTITKSIAILTIMYAIRMIGITLLLMPVTTWGLNSLKQEEISHGSAINSTVRQVSGAIGSSILITVMTTVTKHSLSTSKALAEIEGMNTSFKIATVIILVGLVISLIYVKDKDKNDKGIDIDCKESVLN